jgi:hypothetical protein
MTCCIEVEGYNWSYGVSYPKEGKDSGVKLQGIYFVRQPFAMRTTFYEMHLINNSSLKHDTSFILNRKECGKNKTERERERAKE